MPLYDFQCQNKKCNHEFMEVYFNWNDDTTKQKCPKCKKKAKKVPSLNARMRQNWSSWDI